MRAWRTGVRAWLPTKRCEFDPHCPYQSDLRLAAQNARLSSGATRSAYLVGAGDYGSVLTVVLEGLTYWSGVWATVILLMALAVTPAATIFRWPAVIDVRRMIGVSALVYTIAHMVIYFAFRHWDFAYIVNDMTTRVT